MDPRRLRSLLFAPAVRPDMFAKLPTRGADVVILDLEDAVPPDSKGEARDAVRHHAPLLAEAGCVVFVRVNGADTPWFESDIAETLAAASGVLVPKVETIDGLNAMSNALDTEAHTDLLLIAGLETALGVADCRLLLSHPRVGAGYFGAEDLIADMGGRRTETNHEVAYARSAVALAARVAGVVVFDQVVTRYDDDARFALEAGQARDMGYVGKMCIHPRQVDLANQAFSPSAADVDVAQRLVAAYQDGVARGLAAIDFEGQMVDGPLAAQAEHLIDAARFHGIAATSEGAS